MKNKSMLRILALVVVLSMIFTTAAFASPGKKKFNRDEEGYKNAINYLIEKEIMKGYGHGDYGLEGNVKRGDVIVMIARAFKLEISNEELGENFLDVAKGDYFYGPVKAAKAMGIAKGDGKYFKPNKPVTIQEAIWLIERAEQLLDENLDIEEEDLDVLFEEEELGKFAKRKDIAFMLHYMMTGENDYENDEDEDEDDIEDDEINDIKYEIDEDEILPLKSSDNNMKKSIEDILEGFDSDIEYVKFDYPVKNGTLYYEFDEDDNENELVTENKEYYLDGSDEDLLDEITFVPKNDFNGTVNINFYAHVDEDDYYSGKIVVTVGDEEDEELENLALIKYTINENTEKQFAENDLNSNMDEVKFVQPDEDEGTLYIDRDDDVEVNENVFYADEKFGQVTFVPAQDFTGKVDIEYIAKDGEDSYAGIIRITVKEVQEIKTMEIEVDEDKDLEYLIIDFEDELDDLTNEDKIFTQDVFNAIDYVTFELPSQGKLMIDMGSSDGYKNVVGGTEYDIDDIIGLKYVPVDDFDSEDELVKFNFTAFDGNEDDKEYNGMIEITVVD